MYVCMYVCMRSEACHEQGKKCAKLYDKDYDKMTKQQSRRETPSRDMSNAEGVFSKQGTLKKRK